MATVINGTDNTAATPALTGTDTDTGVFFPAANTMALSTGGTEKVRVESSGNVGIGTNSPTGKLHVSADGGLYTNLIYKSESANTSILRLAIDGDGPYVFQSAATSEFRLASQFASSFLTFYTGTGGERMRLTAGGQLLIGSTNYGTATQGSGFGADGFAYHTRSGDTPLVSNRLGNDGTLISLQQASVEEGSISVSGSTVSYNGGHLSRWSQMLTKPELLKGTVMSNLDEMNVYIAPTTYWAEEDKLPEGVNIGDVKVESHEVQNEQLNKVKVSDVEGDVNVAGVFVNWFFDEQHNVDEINMAMTGDMIIRIADGVVVQKGDLLMSAGDGTAKPQGDDIVRSKTVAKVTSNHVTCTYADGSYCVPCVLMAC